MNTNFRKPTPVISVIMPVYNGADFLDEAIRSVLAQTHADFELVISDDGSTDVSLGIIRSYTDSRIRILSPERHGLFENLNRLLRESRGPLVHILCQDDIMEPDCLEETTRFLALHTTAGMLFSKSRSIDASGRVVSVCELHDLPVLMEPMLTLQCLFYHGCIPGNLSTVCIRRACFNVVGAFDSSYGVAADYEMWTRLGQRWDMGVCHKHLLKIRTHEKQLSRVHSSGIEFVQQNRRICAKLLPKLPAEIRMRARSYENRRHSVLAIHYGLRCLGTGNPAGVVGVIRALGTVGFIRGLFYWLVTINNRLFRPRWHFVLPESNSHSAISPKQNSL